jgi:hypothetical protein
LWGGRWKKVSGYMLDYILIQEARDALVVEERGWRGQFDAELWVGGGAESWVGRGAAREEKLGCVQSRERFGEGEALVKEETDGD